MAKRSKQQIPPSPDHSENDGEDEVPPESPRGNTPPQSPPQTESPPHKIPTPPPSPKQTPPKPTPKVPVSVIPTSTTETSLPHPLVSTVSISLTTLSAPITHTTTTTLPEQTARVNVSDTGAPTETEPPVITKPISPTHSTESGATLGGDNDEYDSTYFSPYRLQSDEDTDTPINRQHLQSIHEKLDKLLADNKAYGGVVLKAFVETTIDQYTQAMDKSTDAIKESTSTCKKASANVAEVIRTTQIFIDSLKGHADTNAAKIRESVGSFSQSLKEEQQIFDDVRSSIKADNASLIGSVSSRLDSLHVDIAKESALKEEIARQASTIAVQQVQLAQSEKEISLLKTERAVFRSCANDVKDMLTNLLGAHDPILTLTIRNHLTTKLLPALAMLHEMKGSGPTEKLKQIVNDSDSDVETITDALKRKKRDKELDENLKITKEAEEIERRNKEEEDILQCKKALFPEWTRDVLISQAIESPSVYWLEPIASFDYDNSKDSQFDMPITRKSFTFHCFDSTVEVPFPNPKLD
ncbi:uncharacterized protein LOC111903350 [Lactuca sativa]|uniref:uncharacterized protein LOC111903350 n=1 Tax=Lactuca sativa TaxID=4236 RepID=UPI000CD8405D|nr:uncharacterized protein LOC111903350 [Lactuca sativa]